MYWHFFYDFQTSFVTIICPYEELSQNSSVIIELINDYSRIDGQEKLNIMEGAVHKLWLKKSDIMGIFLFISCQINVLMSIYNKGR